MLRIKKLLVEFALTFLLFIPYLPLLVVGLLLVTLKAMILKLKLATGYKCTMVPTVGKICYRNAISDITNVSTLEEYQFLKYRSPLYLFRMAVWTPWEAARFFLGNHKPGLTSEGELLSSVMNTVFAHAIVWDNDIQMYKLSLSEMESYSLYRNYFWDCKEICFNKEHTKMRIVMSEGQELNWPCPESKLADWNLAKLHAQVCMTFFAPGLSHNHVHFVFPSTVTVIAKRILPEDSFLRRLLQPHMRFTERINYQALQLNRSTDNKHNFFDQYYLLWKAIPINLEQFIAGIARKCHQFYYKYNENSKKQNPDSSDMKHPHFPPNYVQDKELQNIPYLEFLASYYEPVKKYVQSVQHLIDTEEWDDMKRAMATHVPGIENADMVEVIATFIHQVAVVHYCDHESYLKFFARQYGCFAIRFPFESFDNVEHWDEVLDKTKNLSAKQVKNNPEMLVKESDVMRTMCFLNCFVDYIPGICQDLSLLNVKYNFDPVTEKSAVYAADQFKQDLLSVDKSLREQDAATLIPGRDFRLKRNIPFTKQLIPAQEFIASVCY